MFCAQKCENQTNGMEKSAVFGVNHTQDWQCLKQKTFFNMFLPTLISSGLDAKNNSHFCVSMTDISSKCMVL